MSDLPIFDWQGETVASQYANSPIINALLGSFFAAADQTENFDSFYDDIWNIETATSFGLDLWGRILGVSRILEITTTGAPACFGFKEATDALPFNTGSDTSQGGGAFYTTVTVTNSYSLSDDAYRLLLMAKAAANVTNCSIPALNQILQNLFPGRGNAYVTDGYTGIQYFGFAEAGAQPFGQEAFYDGETLNNVMVMQYIFSFALSPLEKAIVLNSGVLPVPTGVGVTITTP